MQSKSLNANDQFMIVSTTINNHYYHQTKPISGNQKDLIVSSGPKLSKQSHSIYDSQSTSAQNLVVSPRAKSIEDILKLGKDKKAEPLYKRSSDYSNRAIETQNSQDDSQRNNGSLTNNNLRKYKCLSPPSKPDQSELTKSSISANGKYHINKLKKVPKQNKTTKKKNTNLTTYSNDKSSFQATTMQGDTDEQLEGDGINIQKINEIGVKVQEKQPIQQATAKKPLFQAIYVSSKDALLEGNQFLPKQPSSLKSSNQKVPRPKKAVSKQNHPIPDGTKHKELFTTKVNGIQSDKKPKTIKNEEQKWQYPTIQINEPPIGSFNEPFTNLPLSTKRSTSKKIKLRSPKNNNSVYTRISQPTEINQAKGFSFNRNVDEVIKQCNTPTLRSPKSSNNLSRPKYTEKSPISRNPKANKILENLSSHSLLPIPNCYIDVLDFSHQSSITGIEPMSQKSNSLNSQGGSIDGNNQILVGINKTLNFLKGKFLKKRSQCDCNKQQYFDTSICENALIWIHIINNKTQKQFDYQQTKKHFKFLSDQVIDVKDENQIQRDLYRTFPENSYFSKESEGCQLLYQILVNLCKIDQERGYIQGMNFIAACLLLHSDEIVAFGLLEILLVDYELKEVYAGQLTGLYKHCKIQESLIGNTLPKLYDHFQRHQVIVEMFASDWFISLFTSSMPITKTTKFFNLFFKDGWIVVYKIILMILKTFQKSLMKSLETGDILVTLKSNELFGQTTQPYSLHYSEKFWENVFSKMDADFQEVNDDLIQKLKIQNKIK